MKLHDPFLGVCVDAGLGIIVIATAMYVLLRLFGRNRGDGDKTPSSGPPFDDDDEF
jgi:hypothetical protein